MTTPISPCFGEGSGLKLEGEERDRALANISPCFGEGSGLKRELQMMSM